MIVTLTTLEKLKEKINIAIMVAEPHGEIAQPQLNL
jgi:hypothetical protein